jgi:hypothetical protein
VWLPVERAVEVDETEWGEFHPWVGRDGFWDGVAMIYTPETMAEADVALRIIVDADNFITGSDLDPHAVNQPGDTGSTASSTAHGAIRVDGILFEWRAAKGGAPPYPMAAPRVWLNEGSGNERRA